MASSIKLSSPATREFWEVPVLAEDETVLVLDKPSGLLVSPDRYDPDRPNLMRLLHRDIARGAPWVRERGISYLANAHRLDFETSGVILLAKSKPALVHFANLFGIEKPAKEYLTLVQGNPKQDRWKVNAKIGHHPTRPGWMRIDPKDGKKSITEFEVLERFSGYAWVLCRPWTGRTHQIRVHLSHSKHPISGDMKYGGRLLFLSRLKKSYRLKPGATERPLISRTALHASRLSIEHPAKGTIETYEAELPKDIRVALKYLRLFAPLRGMPAATGEAEVGSESVLREEPDQPNGDEEGSDQEESSGVV